MTLTCYQRLQVDQREERRNKRIWQPNTQVALKIICQKMTCHMSSLLVLLVALLSVHQTVSQTLNFSIPISDGSGTKLFTILSLPPSNMKQPPYDLVLERTPYGTKSLRTNAMIFNSAEFAYAGQDDRGCHDSNGDYSFWRSENIDSFETMKFFMNDETKKVMSGKVYSLGASANAISAYFQGKTKNPWLNGQCLIVGTADVHKFTFQGGAFRQQDISAWLAKTGHPQYVSELIDHEAMGDYWESILLRNGENVTYPSLHMGGWNDLFLDGTVNAFGRYYVLVVSEKFQKCIESSDLMIHLLLLYQLDTVTSLKFHILEWMSCSTQNFSVPIFSSMDLYPCWIL